MFKYPFAVIRHARQKYVARLRDARQHMIAFVTQTAVFLVILYFLPIAEDVREEARLVLAGVASLFLSLGFSFVLDLLRSPGQLWADLTERVAKLEQRLTPILAAVPYNGGMPALWMAHYERGIMPGSLAASAPEHDRYLAIEFWNRTDADLQNIRAHLIDLQRDDGSATVFNRPIDLQWLVLGDVPETLVEIPPGARRKLSLRTPRIRVSFFTPATPFPAHTTEFFKGAETSSDALPSCRGWEEEHSSTSASFKKDQTRHGLR